MESAARGEAVHSDVCLGGKILRVVPNTWSKAQPMFEHFLEYVIIKFRPLSHPHSHTPSTQDFMHSVVYIKSYPVKHLYPDVLRCKFIHRNLISLPRAFPLKKIICWG